MPSLRPSLVSQQPNPMFRLAAQAYGRADLIRLNFGEPGFATPAHIAAAAVASIEGERQGYGPSNGPPWLRDSIAARVARVDGYRPAPEQVIVTPGGTGALMAALLCLCREGDEVLVPDPGWPGYEAIFAAAGARGVPYPLRGDAGWEPDLARIEALVGPRTGALLINSPSNPGGAVFARETIEDLVALAVRHDLWIVSDECYDELIFAGEHISPATLAAERVIAVGTCSKSYAMTGWRVGWAVAPAAVAGLLATVVAAQLNNLPLFVLRAAQAALTGPQECVAAMRTAYQARRDLALETLRPHGLADYTPQGAFYLLVEVARVAARPDGPPFDSVAFAEALLAEHGVLVAPGGAFGARIPGHVRISLAGEAEPLRVGLERLVGFSRAWAQRPEPRPGRITTSGAPDSGMRRMEK
jgi:aspartate aminotransferase/aminotransferase